MVRRKNMTICVYCINILVPDVHVYVMCSVMLKALCIISLRLLLCSPPFNLLKPTGYGIHQQVEHFNNCTRCPHCIYVFCIYLKINSDLSHLYKKLIGFVTEMKSVYNVVRTGSLNEALCALSFKG
jgi:hypothetical protein